MKRGQLWMIFVAILVMAAVAATSGCGHTLSGVGQDLYNLGQSITPTDQRHTQENYR